MDDPFEEIFAFTHPNGSTSPDTSGSKPFVEVTFAVVPEPSAGLLFIVGLAGLGRMRGSSARVRLGPTADRQNKDHV